MERGIKGLEPDGFNRWLPRYNADHPSACVSGEIRRVDIYSKLRATKDSLDSSRLSVNRKHALDLFEDDGGLSLVSGSKWVSSTGYSC